MSLLPRLFLCGFLAALAAVPLMKRLAFRLGMVDLPAHRKSHLKPVPYLGGGAVFTGVLCAALAACLLAAGPAVEGLPKALFLLFATLGAAAVGLVDDRINLRASRKFLGQILAATVFVLGGYRLQVAHLPGMDPVLLEAFSLPLTYLWVLAVTNAMNLVDGVDGLAGSVSFVILCVLAGSAVIAGDWGIAFLCVGAAGAVLGFLAFNWRPASIYLGDAGSTGLGMLVAVCAVSLSQGGPRVPWAQFPGISPAEEPFPYQLAAITLLAAYPAFDTTLSVARRLLRGNPIGRADRGHIHHRLQARGWQPQAICLAAGLFTLMAAGTLPLLLRGALGWALALGLLTAAAAVAGVVYCGYGKVMGPREIRRSRPHFSIANHFISMQKTKVALSQHPLEVLALIDQVCLEFGVLYYSLFLFSPWAGRPRYVASWERPRHLRHEGAAAAKKLFTDRLGGADSPNRVFWCFGPLGQEADIDVEHRVLVHEFMLHAVGRAQELYAQLEQELMEEFLKDALKRGGPLREKLGGLIQNRQKGSFLSSAELKNRAFGTP